MQPSDSLTAALNAAIALARSRAQGHVPIVGVAGPQGSGKTTLVQAFAAPDPSIAAFSLDDVYLPASDRRDMAAVLAPMLATRGPPGTHDLAQLQRTMEALQSAGEDDKTPIPAFDKVKDDPAPETEWRLFDGKPSLILLDGWCIGATAQPDEALLEPVNLLEAQEDRLGRWRAYVNERLEGSYARAFARLDAILYVRPPSFEVIETWRGEQEADLLGRALTDDDRTRIARFVAHFERITRSMMAGGHRADIVVQLDEGRGVKSVERGPA